METYKFEDVLDEMIGAEGTAQRTAFDREVQEEADIYNMGEAIRKARIQRGLTQEALGQLIGVKRSRMCQIEKGIGLTLATISRSLKAMNIKTNIVMDGVGSYALT